MSNLTPLPKELAEFVEATTTAYDLLVILLGLAALRERISPDPMVFQSHQTISSVLPARAKSLEDALSDPDVSSALVEAASKRNKSPVRACGETASFSHLLCREIGVRIATDLAGKTEWNDIRSVLMALDLVELQEVKANVDADYRLALNPFIELHVKAKRGDGAGNQPSAEPDSAASLPIPSTGVTEGDPRVSPAQSERNAETKKRKVSEKSEKQIREAIQAVPRNSTQRVVADKAGLDEKTVRYSNAWKGRWGTWGTSKPPSDTTEVDQDAMLDIESFLKARLDITHHKTRARVTRFMANGDTHSQFYACLAEMNKGLESEGRTLRDLSADHAAEPIRSAAEQVAEANPKNQGSDKCPA